LIHHQKIRKTPPWLNLGLALRRMSLHRLDGIERIKRQRLQYALEMHGREQLAPQLAPAHLTAN
jgi:hypothetical protein